MERKTRVKLTNFEKDIHIRISEECFNSLNLKAEKLNVTRALLVRKIIEDYLKNDSETCETYTDVLEYFYNE